MAINDETINNGNNEKEEPAMKKKGNKRKWFIGGGIIGILLIILCLRACNADNREIPDSDNPTITEDNGTNVDDVEEMILQLIGKPYNFVKYGEEYEDQGVRICGKDNAKVEYPEELANVWVKAELIDENGETTEVVKEHQGSKCDIDTTKSGKYIITYTYKGENGNQIVTRVITVGENSEAENVEDNAEESESNKPETTETEQQNPETDKKDETQNEQERPSEDEGKQPSDESENPSISGVIFEGKTVTYDKTVKYLEAKNIPEKVTVKYYNNYHTSAGKYLVTAVFYDTNGKEIGRLQAWLVIKKATPNMSSKAIFESRSFDYDGQMHYLAVTDSKLPPEVFVVRYENNGRSAVGSQWVKVYFGVHDPRNYEIPAPMSAKLTIKDNGGGSDEDPKPIVKKDIDMSGVVFLDRSYAYDGWQYSIYVDESTLPEVVYVDHYEGNKQSMPGTYIVTAYFGVTDPKNYNVPAPMQAKLTIVKKENPDKEDIDMSGVEFTGLEHTFDGTKKYVEVIKSTLPSGVTVLRDGGNGKINAGMYDVVFYFSVDTNKYNPVDPIKVTMKIAKGTKDMSGVVFADGEFEEDGKEHFIYVDKSTLPENVAVDHYENNGRSIVGSQKVTVYFKVTDSNYETPAPMTATLTIKEKDTPPIPVEKEDIDTSGMEYLGLAVVYDGTPKYVTVKAGTIPTGIKDVIFVNNGNTVAGEHEIEVQFKVTDETKYNVPASIKLTQTIYDLRNVSFESDFETETEGKFVITVDGKDHGIYLVGVPSGLKVSYTDANGNTFTSKYVQSAAGTYDVTATISTKDGKTVLGTKSATLIIKEKDTPPIPVEKEDIDTSGMEYLGLAVVYDGTPKYVTVKAGTIPTGIKEVVFVNNGNTVAGEHEIEVQFKVTDETKYNVPSSIKLTQTIYDLRNVSFESDFETETEGKFVITADGKDHGIYLVGVPSGLKVSYTDANGNTFTSKYVQSAAGTYDVTATISTKDGKTVLDTKSATLIIKEKDTPPIPVEKEDIDTSGMEYLGLAVVYDGTPKYVTVKAGTIPTGIKDIIFVNNGNTVAGEHEIEVQFKVTDETKYNVPASIKLTQTIYDLRNVSFESDFETETEGKFVITADGKDHGIYLVGVPSSLKVSYTDANGNTFTSKYVQSVAGTYDVTATISTKDGKTVLDTKSATLIIKEKDTPPVVKPSYKIGVAASPNEVEIGDEITFTISISDIAGADDFEGFIALGGTLDYDKNVLEYVKLENSNTWNISYNDDSGKFAGDRGTLSKADETVFTVTFRAKAATTETTISVTGIEAGGQSSVGDVFTDDASATVKVNEKTIIPDKYSFNVSASATPEEVKVGEEFNVTFSISDIHGPDTFEGFIGLTGMIGFDEDVLELVKTEGSSNWEAPGQSKGAFAVTRSSKGTSDEAVFTLTFRAKKASESTIVTITDVKASGGLTTGDVSATSDANAIVTVKESDKKTVDGSTVSFVNEYTITADNRGPFSVAVAGDLPEGIVEVQFGENNSQTIAGTYEIPVTFIPEAGWTIENAPTSVTLIINPEDGNGGTGDDKPVTGDKKADGSKVKFVNEYTITADNRGPFSVAVAGDLPEGIAEVQFGENNSQTIAGTYEIPVTFIPEAGWTIENAPTSVTLIINPEDGNGGTGDDKPVTGDKKADGSKVKFVNEYTITADNRGPFSVAVDGDLPEGIAEVQFGENNSQTNAGNYEIPVTFIPESGWVIENAPTSVTLIINPEEGNDGTGEDESVSGAKKVNGSAVGFVNEYTITADNRGPFSVAVDGDLPEGILEVQFGGNNSQTIAGNYEIPVTFIPESGWVIENAPTSVTLIINPEEGNNGAESGDVEIEATNSTATTLDTDAADTTENSIVEVSDNNLEETGETDEEKAARLAEEERLAKEAEAKRLEAERLAEEERLAKEAEAKRLEAERLAEEEAERQAKEKAEAQKEVVAPLDAKKEESAE